MEPNKQKQTRGGITRQPVLLCAALCIALSTDVSAQVADDDEFLEEVVVTARKRDETVQEIPVALSVVGGTEIDQRGISDLRDLAALLPSVTFDRGIAQGDFRPAIRGLQAERGRTSVGILIDGIDVTSETLQTPGGGFLANQRLLDVERIEVVKGPQSALYGRSAFGGAINYITRRPDMEEVEYRSMFEANSEQGYELRGAFGAPIIEDKLAVRMNGYLWDQRGNFRNTVSGDYVGGGDGYGISGSVLALPTDNISVFGTLAYSEDEFDPRAVFLLEGNTTVAFSADEQTVTGLENRIIYQGELSPQPISLDLDPATGGDYPGASNPKLRFSLVTEIGFGDMDFTSLTSFNRADFDAREDGDVSAPLTADAPITGAFLQSVRSNETKQLSQEIRLQSNNDSDFQWLVGGLYWREDVAQNDLGINGLALAPLVRADYDGFFRDIESITRQRQFSRDTEHYSWFAFAEYAITDQLSLSVEGRYSSETIDYAVDQSPGVDGGFTFFYGLLGGATPGSPVTLPLVTIDGASNDRIKEDFFLPRAAISYAASDTVNFYASIGKGVKPAGNDTGGVVEFDDSVRYGRETLWAYEVGTKTQWFDGGLTVNPSLFYQDYEDQQVSSQIFNQELQILRSVIENAGNSVIWGFELDVAYRVNEKLNVGLGYTYLNAEFKDFTVLSTSASRIAESPCRLVTFASGPPACELNRSGNRPADLPKHRVIGQINYYDQLNEKWDWFAQGLFSYNSEEFAETSNVIVQSAITNVDLTFGLENDRWRIAAFVQNLTDADEITDANLGVDYRNGFLSTANGFLQDPRTFGVRVNFTY